MGAPLFCGRLLFLSAAFEGQFGDAALVEAAKAELGQLGVLIEGGGGEGQVELLLFGQLEGDAAVFGGVGGAVSIFSSLVSLSSCTFTSNTAAYEWVFNPGGPVNISRDSFVQHTKPKSIRLTLKLLVLSFIITIFSGFRSL